MFKSSSKAIMSRIFRNKSEIKKPNIFFTEEVLLKFKAYVDSCAKEIGWLAFVKKTDDNTYVVYDTILPKQEVTSVTTELTEQGLQDVSEEILMTRPDEFNNIRCWCHSHVNMQVFPSGTDEETFEQFYQNCEYFIRVICNKKNDMRVDFVDLEQEVRFDNTEWNYYTMPSTDAKYIAINNYKNAIKQAEKAIAKLNKEIGEEQQKVYGELKKDIEVDVKKKLIEERSKYKSLYGGYYDDSKKSKSKKDYNAVYNYDDYYLGGHEQVRWENFSYTEKEEYCEIAGVTFLDSSVEGTTLVYLNPLDVLTKAEYIKVLEAGTVNELKSLLKTKPFTCHYTEDDWNAMYEELEYFGTLYIEEEIERSLDYGY